ncbi:MAG: C39 family peptidase [Candidatus Atribacteria bacterium]|nr:C39 family peptidase [Candidatus Atribacteria bacterium]
MKAMGKITITLILILATSLFLTSCSGIVTPELPPNLEEDLNKVEEIASVYLDVPYEKYAGTNWCLPASGAMTLKYFGFNISQAEIASQVIDDNGSSSVFKFISFATDLGLEAKYKSKTIEEIKVLLNSETPVIAIQNYSLTILKTHARVIIGYDDETQEIITNDPTAGKDYRISYADFLSLNLNSSPDKCKVIVISTEEIDTKNAELLSDINNS